MVDKMWVGAEVVLPASHAAASGSILAISTFFLEILGKYYFDVAKIYQQLTIPDFEADSRSLIKAY